CGARSNPIHTIPSTSSLFTASGTSSPTNDTPLLSGVGAALVAGRRAVAAATGSGRYPRSSARAVLPPLRVRDADAPHPRRARDRGAHMVGDQLVRAHRLGRAGSLDPRDGAGGAAPRTRSWGDAPLHIAAPRGDGRRGSRRGWRLRGARRRVWTSSSASACAF